MDQITSNRFELIHIRSIHTSVTESEFNYELRKLYCVSVWSYEDLFQNLLSRMR